MKTKQYTHKQLIIRSYDLPLYCNGNNIKSYSNSYSNSNSNPLDLDCHPKVYLPIKEKKILACPYCGIEYILLQ